jgi:glucose-1-phosphate adenylyltransferase
MDYSRMIAEHKKTGADATIAVIEVNMEEASRFGIMSVNGEGQITEFEEKPTHPKSTLASMGIYVFSWEKLKRYLVEDEADCRSKNDFGGNIIPKMLDGGEKLMAYQFAGYWKDVGTIDSLWDANMDMLASNSSLNMFDANWKIYSRNPTSPPHYIGRDAVVSHSVITDGCEVCGTVENSVLFSNVTVGEGAVVRYSTIMPRTVIEPGAVVEYAIIAEDAVIGKNAHVGGDPMMTDFDLWGIAVIASGVKVGEGASVLPQQMAAEDVPAAVGDLKAKEGTGL